MRAIKDNYSFLKALAAVFCCTLLITQSGLLFGQEAEEKSTPSTPAADPETKADAPAKTKEPTDSNSNLRGRGSQDDDRRGVGRGRGGGRGRNMLSTGEEAKEKPENEIPPLAEMLATALENNPDIGVAASQVTAAEAQLKRAQLSVVQQVMDLQETWHTQKQLVEHATASVAAAEKQRKYVKRKYDLGQPSGTAVDLGAAEEQKIKAEVALILAQAKLAEIKAKIPYVLGTQKPVVRTGSMSGRGTGTMSGRGSRHGRARPLGVDATPKDATPKKDTVDDKNKTTKTLLLVPSNKAESSVLAKLREALNQNTELDFQNQPIDDVAEYLRDLHNISVTVDKNAFKEIVVGGKEQQGMALITCNHAGLSLAAALQAIMDLHPRVSFVVRDYGLLVTAKGKEPLGAMTVSDFVKWQPGVGYVGGYVPQAPGGAGGGLF
ncbi:hypothetical protein Pan258_33870 [Symmachiella dynata]|nr:hypothetical protein Pan258_33870 [Symmachiella dynata]